MSGSGPSPARPPSVRALALALALLASGAATGCLYVGGRASVGPRLRPDVAAAIVVGTTTKADVLAMLGPPNEYLRPELAVALLDDRSRLSGAVAAANRAQHVFTWQFDAVDVDGTVLLLFNGFSVETRTDLLVVYFDERDVVADVALRHDGQVR